MGKESKLGYEELVNSLQQITAENSKMREDIKGLLKERNEMMMMLRDQRAMNAFNRVDLLLKVLDHKDCFSSDFVTYCIEDIERIMDISDYESGDDGGDSDDEDDEESVEDVNNNVISFS